ncbi:hypothetical protein EWM64_g10624, partial [Hericium alpestre]
IMQNPSRWCSGSNFQHPFDGGLPDIIELQRIMNRFMEIAKPPAPCPLSRSSLTVPGIVDSFAAELSASSISRHIKSKSSSLDGDIADNLRTGMAIYFLQYCRLLVFVFGLQSELESKPLDLAQSKYLPKCLEATSSLTNAWTQQLGATGQMKYAPDFFFIATGFAGAFLIKQFKSQAVSDPWTRFKMPIFTIVSAEHSPGYLTYFPFPAPEIQTLDHAHAGTSGATTLGRSAESDHDAREASLSHQYAKFARQGSPQAAPGGQDAPGAKEPSPPAPPTPLARNSQPSASSSGADFSTAQSWSEPVFTRSQSVRIFTILADVGYYASLSNILFSIPDCYSLHINHSSPTAEYGLSIILRII